MFSIRTARKGAENMLVLDRETATDLARHEGWPSVSIYLPTHRVHTETPQDLIRFKNLLRSAEEELVASGARTPEVDSLLRPARMLLEDSSFWRHMDSGLAVFIAEDVFHAFRTIAEPPERIFVGDRFLIRPLLAGLRGDERFLVLAISKNKVRLLEGTRTEMRELDVSRAPSSLAEALQYDDYERQVQFHTRTPASASGRGARSAVFHGHGGLPDVAKENLLRYFRAVDKGISDLVNDETAPLVLAGVDYLLPIYREANSYPHLVAETMRGNPDDLTPSELHAEALRVLEPHFRREYDDDLAALDRVSGMGVTSADLGEIVMAASEGRVKVLFVSDRESKWGSFDPSNGHVESHESRLPGDSDLSDLAAVETLLHGGVVHTSPAEEAAPAAIFRY